MFEIDPVVLNVQINQILSVNLTYLVNNVGNSMQFQYTRGKHGSLLNISIFIPVLQEAGSKRVRGSSGYFKTSLGNIQYISSNIDD